jgi:hypothetical protein
MNILSSIIALTSVTDTTSVGTDFYFVWQDVGSCTKT